MTTCEKQGTLYSAYADLMRVGIRESTNFGRFGRIPLVAFYWEIPDPEIIISSVLWPTQIPFEVGPEERENHIEAKSLSFFPKGSAILIGRKDIGETVVLFPESSGVIKTGINRLREKRDWSLVHILERHPEDSRGFSLEELDMYSELIANVEDRFPVGEPLW